DLAGPLVRASLYALGAEDHVLLLVLHHLVCDGWSLGVIAEDLAAACGPAPPLAQPAVDFLDHVRWERSDEGRRRRDRALAYWSAVHAGRDEVGDPPFATAAGGLVASTLAVDAAIDEQLLGRVRDVARVGAGTAHATWLAVLAVLVHLHDGRGLVA